jgi:hypothetical protein
VVVDAGAEEGDARDDVLRSELLEMTRELRLGERRRHLEVACEPDATGDVAEEFVNRRDPDRGQHLLAIGVGEREVAHCVSSSSR